MGYRSHVLTEVTGPTLAMGLERLQRLQRALREVTGVTEATGLQRSAELMGSKKVPWTFPRAAAASGDDTQRWTSCSKA